MKNKKIQFFIGALLVLVLILVTLSGFNLQIRKSIEETSLNSLEEVLYQQEYNFEEKLKGELSAVNHIGKMYPDFSGDISEIVAYMNYIIEDSNFNTMVVVGVDGIGVSNLGNVIDVSDRLYFQETVSNNRSTISDPIVSRVTNDDVVIALSSPINRNDELVGVIICTLKTASLDQLFGTSFDGAGYAYVTTKNGDIIAKTTNSYTITKEDNLFDDWGKAIFSSEKSLDELKIDLENQNPGYSVYDVQGKNRYVYYDALDTKDWYIFSIVPKEVILENAYNVTNWVLLLTVIITIGFGLFFIALAIIQSRNIKKLYKVAFIDELTNISNFKKFMMDAPRIIKAHKHNEYIIIKFDIDRFKLFNDVFGMKKGNELLQTIALAWKEMCDNSIEMVARINADEFIILKKFTSFEKTEEERIQFEEKVNDSMKTNYEIKFNYGRYLIESKEVDFQDIYEKVNFAHRNAKENKDTNLCDFDNKIMQMKLREKEIENKMNYALKSEQFKVYLQPKYRLSDEKIIGAEALVRWQENDIDVVYPGSFIPLFERNGFVTKIDMYMFEKVCSLIHNWLKQGLSPVPISVNFSRLHLSNECFVKELIEITERYNVPPSLVEIELTETDMIQNEDILLGFLNQIHEVGFKLSMDDFGAGYSSLGLLKNIPVDTIKIDRSFFINEDDPKRMRVVLKNVIMMAKELDIETVAEGVETLENVTLLKEIGCDIVQGFYYERPIPADKLKF